MYVVNKAMVGDVFYYVEARHLPPSIRFKGNSQYPAVAAAFADDPTIYDKLAVPGRSILEDDPNGIYTFVMKAIHKTPQGTISSSGVEHTVRIKPFSTGGVTQAYYNVSDGHYYTSDSSVPNDSERKTCAGWLLDPESSGKYSTFIPDLTSDPTTVYTTVGEYRGFAETDSRIPNDFLITAGSGWSLGADMAPSFGNLSTEFYINFDTGNLSTSWSGAKSIGKGWLTQAGFVPDIRQPLDTIYRRDGKILLSRSFGSSEKVGTGYIQGYASEFVPADFRVDTDEDGVSDEIERAMGLTNKSHSDTDGDGITDLRELQQGSDPTNPHSTVPTNGAESGSISGPRESRIPYRLEFTNINAGENWFLKVYDTTDGNDFLVRSIPAFVSGDNRGPNHGLLRFLENRSYELKLERSGNGNSSVRYIFTTSNHTINNPELYVDDKDGVLTSDTYSWRTASAESVEGKSIYVKYPKVRFQSMADETIQYRRDDWLFYSVYNVVHADAAKRMPVAFVADLPEGSSVTIDLMDAEGVVRLYDAESGGSDVLNGRSSRTFSRGDLTNLKNLGVLWLEHIKGASRDAIGNWGGDNSVNNEPILSVRYLDQTRTRRDTKLPLYFVGPRVVPDYDRDGAIRVEDQAIGGKTRRSDYARFDEHETFYFWVNDDNDDADESEVKGNDIPGKLLDAKDADVDGTRDLVDFFPVLVDLGGLLADEGLNVGNDFLERNLGENFEKVEIRIGGKNVNFLEVQTADPDGIAPEDAGRYHSVPAFARELTGVRVQNSKQSMPTSAEFVRKVFEGKGMLLIEGREVSEDPLTLECFIGGRRALELEMPLKLSGVEDMYRHINLLYAVGASGGRPTDLGHPDGWPDSITNERNFVLVHGYNVTPEKARGWHAEVFKRLFWSGSQAKFTGVTWHGSPGGFGPAPPDYYEAVINAFRTSHQLADKLVNTPNVCIAGHSLANMVIGAAIEDHGLSPDNYFMIDAAVPMEAYDKSDLAVSNMTNSRWVGYDPKLWASNWWDLFDGFATNGTRISELIVGFMRAVRR